MSHLVSHSVSSSTSPSAVNKSTGRGWGGRGALGQLNIARPPPFSHTSPIRWPLWRCSCHNSWRGSAVNSTEQIERRLSIPVGSNKTAHVIICEVLYTVSQPCSPHRALILSPDCPSWQNGFPSTVKDHILQHAFLNEILIGYIASLAGSLRFKGAVCGQFYRKHRPTKAFLSPCVRRRARCVCVHHSPW